MKYTLPAAAGSRSAAAAAAAAAAMGAGPAGGCAISQWLAALSQLERGRSEALTGGSFKFQPGSVQLPNGSP
jgi:hypothetical protein